MGRDWCGGGDLKLALRRQFEREGRELLLAASQYEPAEAIMRLRALGEISAGLPTTGLLELALKVTLAGDAKPS